MTKWYFARTVPTTSLCLVVYADICASVNIKFSSRWWEVPKRQQTVSWRMIYQFSNRCVFNNDPNCKCFLMCEETDGPILTYYWPIKLVFFFCFFFADKKMTLFSYRPFQPEVFIGISKTQVYATERTKPSTHCPNSNTWFWWMYLNGPTRLKLHRTGSLCDIATRLTIMMTGRKGKTRGEKPR